MNARMREQLFGQRRSLQGPDWRSQVAQALPLSQRGERGLCDALTLQAAEYFAGQSRGAAVRRRVARALPEIDAAITLQRDADQSAAAKLLVLVDAPHAQIATRLGSTSEVVAVWEQLYFDVRPLLGAVNWLATHVVGAERKAGQGALAARMKLAIVAGATAVDAMLEMDDGPPLDEADRLFQRMLKLDFQFDEAVAMSIDSDRNRMQFIRLRVELQVAKQRLTLDGQKLAARCTREHNRHELAKLRLVARQQRAEQQIRDASQPKQRRRKQADDAVATAGVNELVQAADTAETMAQSPPVTQPPATQPPMDLTPSPLPKKTVSSQAPTSPTAGLTAAIQQAVQPVNSPTTSLQRRMVPHGRRTGGRRRNGTNDLEQVERA